MYQYFTLNILCSLIIFIYLYALKSAPHKIRFRLVVFGLLSWLLPYDLINNYLTQDSTVLFSTVISGFNGSIKHTIISNVRTETFITLLNLIKIMTFIGFLLFIKDIISLKTKLKQLNKQAKPFKTINGINIYTTKENDVFTAGISSPKIYLGENHLNSPHVESIIQHELQHIKHHDQYWLLFITFVQRILWWNPLVRMLANKGRDLIELRCDQACNKQNKNNQYQQDLAQILLNQNNQVSNRLINHLIGKSKLNIFRVKQLSKEFTMNTKNKALIFSTALIPFVLMLFVSTTSVSSEETNSRIENEQGERAKNEVDLTIKFNAIEYKKTTPITVSTTNLFEHRSNIKYETVFDFIQGINTGGEDRLYRFKATPKRVDDEKILIDFILKYTINGKETTETPSLMVLNGTRAIIVLDDETDDYKFEIEVLPRF